MIVALSVCALPFFIPPHLNKNQRGKNKMLPSNSLIPIRAGSAHFLGVSITVGLLFFFNYLLYDSQVASLLEILSGAFTFY